MPLEREPLTAQMAAAALSLCLELPSSYNDIGVLSFILSGAPLSEDRLRDRATNGATERGSAVRPLCPHSRHSDGLAPAHGRPEERGVTSPGQHRAGKGLHLGYGFGAAESNPLVASNQPRAQGA